jgi:RNA polymerase sigma-70 factor (ECF subfamily)
MSNVHNMIEHEIPRLRRCARALTRSADRADDLVQDTIIRAITKAHLWQAGTDLRAWLFTIMHNRHVNNVRSTAREDAMIDIDEMSSSLAATSDPTASRQLREFGTRACPPARRATRGDPARRSGRNVLSGGCTGPPCAGGHGTVRSRLSRGLARPRSRTRSR